MSDSLKKQMDEIDDLIRKAQWKAAQALLSSMKRKQFASDTSYQIAALATRANLPKMALSLLRPIVYPSGKIVRQASDYEKVEYAIALTRLGAEFEASNLLQQVSSIKVPRSLSYKAILCMKQWKYREAVPLLSEYLSKENDEYFRINGMSNLVQCLIFLNRFGEATQLLPELLSFSENRGLVVHKANVLSYTGMIEFYSNRFPSAIKHFENAATILVGTDGLDLLFIKKWLAITELHLTDGSRKSCKELERVRREAVERSHWETVRDVDFRKALFFNDEPLLLKLYFGTPFQGFRDRLVSKVPTLPVHEPYLWLLGGENGGPREIIDLNNERKTSEGDYLKAGQTMQRLYIMLASDFYRPFGIATLFEKMFPQDRYHVISSKGRVFQHVIRLRLWFKKNRIPLVIDCDNGQYRLNSDKYTAIALPQCDKGLPLSSKELRINMIKSRFGESEFSVLDLVKTFDSSRSSVTTLLDDAIRFKTIERLGSAKKTRYRFVSSQLKKVS